MGNGNQHSTLRYLQAGSVAHPRGTLADFRVCTSGDQPLGFVGGVLIEPSERRIRYFVIERSSLLKRRRYTVPADSIAILDAEGGKIQIDDDDADELMERFDPASVLPFSDEDLITTIFASNAA